MYNYSPIKKLKVKNFRNIGEVELDFTKSPIVTLLGENEAGKTSMIKAFSVCALHDRPKEQKEYIRDNTKMFGVQIDLEDGHQIVRIKEANGVNLVRVIKPDGTVWDTSKMAEGLPKEVSDLMGLITEPETKEYIHVRTYEDKLLFIVTPSSANYKVMYNALKVEQLTKAIDNGSKEANKSKELNNRNLISIQTLSEQLRNIQVYDVEALSNIKERLGRQLDLLARVEKIKVVKDRIEELSVQLGALALLDMYKLDTISELTASKVNSAGRILNNKSELVSKIQNVSIVNDLGEISDVVINKIGNLLSRKAMLTGKNEVAYVLQPVSELNEISEVKSMQLMRAVTIGSKVKQYESKLSLISLNGCEQISEQQISKLDKVKSLLGTVNTRNNELVQVDDYVGQVENYLKSSGVAVETCSKCGETIVIDLDKLK